jgi:hypothetical protein
MSRTPSDKLPSDKLMRFAGALRTLVDNERRLRKLRPAPPAIPHDLAEFVADAIERRLAGQCASLDQALGLARPRGRPKLNGSAAKNYALARKIFWLRWGRVDAATGNPLPPLPWIALAERFDKDPRELQRILARYRERIVAELADAVQDGR